MKHAAALFCVYITRKQNALGTVRDVQWKHLSGHGFNGPRDLMAESYEKFVIISSSHAPECISLLNRALRYKWHAIIILSSSLPDAVPMNRHFHSFHVILDVDDDPIVLADLDARPWDHSVGRQNSSLDTVS